MSDGFRFDDPRQASLYAELQKIGDWPAAAFRDMCTFFATDSPVGDLETIAHLAMHLQREIKSAMTDVLLPLDFEPPNSGVKSKATRGAILQAVARAQKAQAANAATLRDLKRELKAIIKPNEGGDEATRIAILRVFALPEDSLAQLWEQVGKLHNIAHRNALATPRRLDEVREAWDAFQRLLSMLLAQLDTAWSVIYKRIDAILSASPPSEKHIRRLRNNIPNNPNTFRYFFDGAKSKEWVEAVTKGNSLFTNPPNGGPWPAIQYLLQIAPQYPEAVHRIVTRLPSTPNAFTHMAIMQIADVLQPTLAKDLIEQSATAFAEGVLRDAFIISDIAKGAARIATADPTSALASLRKLLALRPPSGESLRDLESPLELHAYIDAITAAGAVSAHAPRATYGMLANLLDESLAMVHPTRGEDNSSGWMPAIEPHEQNHGYEPLPHFAGAVRDAAEAAITANPATLTEIVEDAEGRAWFLFRRLALHLLRRDPTSEIARQHAREPELIQNYAFKHEARLLLRAVFPYLDDRDAIITAMLAGPKDVKDATFTSAEQREDYIEWWIAQRLWWVNEWLTGDAKQRYEQLTAKHHVPDEADDFVAWISTMWVGPTSPKTAEELASVTLPEIIAFLRAWQPGTKRAFGEHSREGVARELRTIATNRGLEFSQAASDFKELDPTYIRGILDGLQSAVQNQHAQLDWERIIDLGEFAVTQDRAISGRTDDGWNDDDPHWGWTRGAIARLLEAGFRPGPAQINLALRPKVWSVLERTFEDPDPTPERDDAPTSDPLTVALNSTRGQALRAIILYALWVRRNAPDEQRVRDFSDMPEVRDRLTTIVTDEPSAGVRAVFGELLHLLYALDATWVREHLDDLFPEKKASRDAVFQTYVVYGKPSLAIDKLLLPQYERAVDTLAINEKYPGHYKTHLARHVMWLYAAHETTLDPGALAARFFEMADAETRSYAIGFAPTAVRDMDEADDQAFREKLEAFWSWCSNREDLAPAHHGFGMWVGEERLDLAWRLTQLERALKLAGGVARDFEVIDDLAAAAAQQPVLVLRCIRLLFDGVDYMRRYTWVHGGEIRRILTDAIANGDATATADARALANHLIGQGFDEFLDLAT